MSTAAVFPIGSTNPAPVSDGLDPDSYTAQRLRHAPAAHLHETTHRFFIGPIPEGWLNSNRKSWYKRRLELGNYSSRKASFNVAADHGPHHRTMTGLDGPSTAARIGFSFPQLSDVNDASNEGNITEAEPEELEELSTSDGEADMETRVIAPVATSEDPGILGTNEEEDRSRSKSIPVPPDRGLDGATPGNIISPESIGRRTATDQQSVAQQSFMTAREHATEGSQKTESPKQARPVTPLDTDRYDSDDQRVSSSINEGSNYRSGVNGAPYLTESTSRTALLTRESPSIRPMSPKSMIRREPAPVENDLPEPGLGRVATSGVRFNVAERLAGRQHRVGQRVSRARDRVARTGFRRNTLREGAVIKMEKMLVRMDFTQQQLPDDFDENESQRTESRAIEKWKEFMVVARKNKQEDSHDFRLQIYNTRVIPEVDDGNTKKKPAREIRLDPKTTHVNLYSSLDKTIVLWHPYKKGTRIIVMRPSSTAHAVEWYTFLRDAMGWHRPKTLQVNVPDLDVTLHLERPFEGLEAANVEATDEETATAKTAAAEQAVAAKIISQCMGMLEGDPEWTNVLKTWADTAKMGLAWRRYDRLEWIAGVNEQKMYGTMAMQNSYDLELRPKHHYPMIATSKKGTKLEEPPPVEGFLIRLTSQKGVHRKVGKAFFKRLYFSTENQFLFFNRPAKATPPHPPRLATISGSNIPSAHEIVEKTPMMYDVEPFATQDGTIEWLNSGEDDVIKRHDREAFEEASRNVANVTASDGYINLCYVAKVRKMQWGASAADDALESGSDVEFHQEVDDTLQEDGTTVNVDDDRTFELVLDNGLVVRLQAYNKQTRDEWMKRLKALVKYWKARTTADMDTYKSVRRANLKHLNIDEEMEAVIGQFARKWEVSRSEASPQLYNMCGMSSCRTIAISGLLYRKARRRATFQRCGVILTGGQMLIYQATLRKATGEQVKHIHQEKQEVIDLKDCYVYSGLIVEDDLLYQNRTFDANHPGMASLPRVWQEDGWTSSDVDVMTCFVVWTNRKKGWFRTASGGGGTPAHGVDDVEKKPTGQTRARLKRVGQLGVPGRAIVFKCRSRAERDHWVLAVASEIERVVEREVRAGEGPDIVRFG